MIALIIFNILVEVQAAFPRNSRVLPVVDFLKKSYSPYLAVSLLLCVWFISTLLLLLLPNMLRFFSFFSRKGFFPRRNVYIVLVCCLTVHHLFTLEYEQNMIYSLLSPDWRKKKRGIHLQGWRSTRAGHYCVKKRKKKDFHHSDINTSI